MLTDADLSALSCSNLGACVIADELDGCSKLGGCGIIAVVIAGDISGDIVIDAETRNNLLRGCSNTLVEVDGEFFDNLVVEFAGFAVVRIIRVGGVIVSDVINVATLLLRDVGVAGDDCGLVHNARHLACTVARYFVQCIGADAGRRLDDVGCGDIADDLGGCSKLLRDVGVAGFVEENIGLMKYNNKCGTCLIIGF
jgi:hypothetical protein